MTESQHPLISISNARISRNHNLEAHSLGKKIELHMDCHFLSQKSLMSGTVSRYVILVAQTITSGLAELNTCLTSLFTILGNNGIFESSLKENSELSIPKM
jgi:hypothetical protein